MDSADESSTRVVSPEVRSLHNLLRVTEELLFSFPLSSDLVKKYEILRENAFTKAGLIHSAGKLRKLQKEAHAKQRVNVSFKETQTDRVQEERVAVEPEVSKLKFSELESRANVIRFELISRIESINDIVRQYQQLLNFILSSLTNELNRFGELINVETVVKYPPIRITEVNRGVDIMPERDLSVEELETEQPKLMLWYQSLEKEHTEHLDAFKEDFDDRNAKFSMLLQNIAERYAEQNECIENLESELKMLGDRSSVQIEDLKNHVGVLTQEMTKERTQKEKEMTQFKAEIAKQTEKSLIETKRTFDSELERLLSDRERSLKSMSEHEKSLLNNRITALQEIEALKRQHEREVLDLKEAYEEQIDKEKKAHRRDVTEKEDELLQKDREWKLTKRRLEEALSKAKESPAEVTTLNSEPKSTQTISESVHRSLQGDLSSLIPELHGRLSPFYQKHSLSDKAWTGSLTKRRQDLHGQLFSLSEYVDLVLETEFAVYFGGKLVTDNAWLVDRLTEFGKENEKLRLAASAPPQTTTVYLSPAKPVGKLHKQVWDDIRSTAATLKEFEEARETLMRKLEQGEGRRK